jgi:pimeloyl-ACP methyl ester carboxylesterase
VTRAQPGLLQPWPPGVDLLKLAQGFHAAGYAVLLFDFRSHGQSQRALCAGGLTEDQDVAGAVDYTFQHLAKDAPEIQPRVGLVGFGTGASAALTAVGREKGSAEVIRFFSGDSEGGSGFVEYQPPNVKRLRFLVAIAPLSMDAYLRRCLHPWLAPLSPLLIPLVSSWCWQRGGYPLRSTYLPRFAGELHLPVLYIGVGVHGADSEVERLYQATPGPKEICWLDAPPPRTPDVAALCTHADPVLSFAARTTDTPSRSEAKPS